MKNIVVGVDFSKTSVLALKYALMIARQTQSDLMLLNVRKHLDYEVPLTAEERKGPQDVVEQFEALLREVGAGFSGNIDFRVGEGAVHQEIANQAKYSNAWLVVVGAHGLSGFEEFWMGSDSYRVVATAKSPVITVRKGYDILRGVKKVILPVDSSLETLQKVPFTLDLVKKFQAQVHVISLYSGSAHELRELVDVHSHDAMRQVEKAGLDLVSAHFETENIANSVIQYAREVDADLVSIMTEQEFASRNIFLGPYAQQMVHRSPVPVLSMHARVLARESFLE